MPPAAPAKPACPRQPRAQRYADPPLGRQLPPASAGLSPRQKPWTIRGESPFRAEKVWDRRIAAGAPGARKAARCPPPPFLSPATAVPVDRPRAVWRRYQGRRPIARYAFWWPRAPIREFPAGKWLAVALPRPAKVHWANDGWRNATDEPTHDSGLGFHVAALDVSRLSPGERVEFTWQWQESGAWHGRDYGVAAISTEER